MFMYLARRIIVFIPTLVAISILAFVINAAAPGDPVKRMITGAQTVGELSSQLANVQEQERFWKRKLGLDLPLFYFSISSAAACDTLYRVYDRSECKALQRLTAEYGNWTEISAWYKALRELEQANKRIEIDSTHYAEYGKSECLDALSTSSFEAISLRSAWAHSVIAAKFNGLEKLANSYAFFQTSKAALEKAKHAYQAIRQNSTAWKNYIPAIHFHGQNQYHRWVFGDGHWLTGKGSEFTRGIIRGDFGTSYVTKQPVSQKIGEKIFWSLFFTLVSVLLAYLVSIPVGVRAAVKKDKPFDRISGIVLFILYSMPSFWVAVLLMMVFANPDLYAGQVAPLPASGVKPPTGYPEGAGMLEKIRLSLPYLVLPTICYTYSSFAFLSRTMRVSMLEVVSQDFIRTARAKGLPERKVIWKHGLRNALLPVITVFANVFPLAIGGSVILESIFTIPGMGFEIYSAILSQDYPMLVAVFVLTGFFTMLGFLISDMLYAIADPRISYTRKK